MKWFIEMIMELFKKKKKKEKEVPIIYVKPRNEVYEAYSDHARMAEDFHDNFTSLDTGLERMAEWAREHGTRETKDFTDIEITKNLPEVWK